jgi:hypothetical protein
VHKLVCRPASEDPYAAAARGAVVSPTAPAASAPVASASASGKSNASAGSGGGGDDDDDVLDVEEGEVYISLKCPLSIMRLRAPAKGAKCRHAQCFDLQVC